MQKAALYRPAQVPNWLDPRRPIQFILRFTLAYAVVVTLGTTLIAYFVKGRHDAFAPTELTISFLAFCLSGFLVALFTLWRARKRLAVSAN